MGRLVASINLYVNGGMIELRLGQKTIETLYITPHNKNKFQVSRIIQEGGSLGDLYTLFHINPGELPSRIVKDNELDNTDVILIKSHSEILFEASEKKCIQFAKKWLENEYS